MSDPDGPPAATEGAPPGPWDERVADRLDAIRARNRWRRVRRFDARGAEGVLDLDGSDGGPEGDGHRVAVTSFASNDYLGLSTHPAVLAAAHDALDRWGAGATASRLVVGSRPPHHALEADLAAWKGTGAALAFPTGYAANLGVVSTLGGPGTLIVSDEMNHASIIDGCRLARGETVVVPHGDVEAVDRVLAADRRPALVVTDTVFSMDGDAADVAALAEVCARRGALLVVDEAHAVLGPDLDPADHPGLALVRVGTLSKTLGTLGGFVACSAPVRDLLVNAARSFIFTTGLAPADAAAARAAVSVVRSDEGRRLGTRLRAVVDRVAPGHPSPIVPVVLGDERAAVEASAALLARGLLVPAIRPPTVPEGTSRLRVALSAGHTDAQVDALLDALGALATPPARGGPGPAAAPPDAARTRPRGRPVAPSRSSATGRPGPPDGPGGGDAAGGPPGPDGPEVVVVLGTGTEVGKTWVATRALAALRDRGVAVAARKPAQSAEPGDPGPSDADVLAGATGEDPEAVCPPHRRYERALAPPMASDALGRPPFSVADLVAEITWAPGTELGLVETAGGVLSPAAHDGTSLDLATALAPDHLVLVADAGLGTINMVRLALAFVTPAPGRADGPRPAVTVVLNRYDPDDPLHRANRAVLDADAAAGARRAVARGTSGPVVVTDPDALVARLTERGARPAPQPAVISAGGMAVPPS